MTTFIIIYWIGIVAEIAIRAPWQKNRKAAKAEQRVSRNEKILLGLLWTFMFILPLVYSVTDWLGFADYTLPVWMGWLGIVLMACALIVFTRAHMDLKSNWSPSLEIFKDHTLVTNGIYGYIRHPMYASQWIWVVAQILLLWNWVAGPLDLLFFIPFYILRVRAEEKMMLEAFGDQYREYMKKTGAVIPKFR
jgi:protein-S-isoprenylcysteine O-methyltransferase Ste14